MPRPRIKILKMHGSLTGGGSFLFSEKEMASYPDIIARTFGQFTKGPVIECGYSFQDLCVLRAFSINGEPIYCVDLNAVPNGLRGFLVNRRSEDLPILGPDGAFDEFFRQLYEGLTFRPGDDDEPRSNPFKYLESYDIADSATFWGRDREIEDLRAKVIRRAKPVICVIGPPKCGKTSLVRAGLVGKLDPNRYLPVYLRCCGGLDQSLGERLRPWIPSGANGCEGVPCSGNWPKVRRSRWLSSWTSSSGY
jgi:hypothetical protein